MTKMEFEVLETGAINDLHVIRSSGNTVFDAAAVDSIYRSGPFPPPPRQILSWNNRVYFRWGFYRNNRKCGVFNAEPYILRAPGSAPEEVPAEEFMVDDG
jgi:TonB family protein